MSPQNPELAETFYLTKTTFKQFIFIQSYPHLTAQDSTWTDHPSPNEDDRSPSFAQMCRNAKTSKNVPNGSSLLPSSETTTSEMTIVLIC